MTSELHISDDGPASTRIGGQTFRKGETYGVEDDLAETLLAVDYFEEGPAPDGEEESSGAIESEDVVAEESEEDSESTYPGDDEWLEPDYEERVEIIESGEADAYLDDIEEAERSQQVLDAVEARREEL